MEVLGHLIQGFSTAVQLDNLVSAFIGAALGTAVGVLPGLGPSTTVALLIPVAFTMRPDTALIMMTGVYLGAMYGGSLTSILLKVPGESSSVLTAEDGYALAKQGQAGPALAIAAIGSFIGGTLSVVALTFLAPTIAHFALRFGPAEYFAVMVFALLVSATLLGPSLLKGLIAVTLGLMLAAIGTDLQTGVSRVTLGLTELLDGVDVVVLIIGVFGVGEVFWFLSRREEGVSEERLAIRGRLWPTAADWVATRWTIVRSSVIGFLAGVLPGSGSTLGSMLAYSIETRVSERPERFGKGAMEGVAAPETANNAATGGALVPLLTLGIPGSGTTAVMLGALMMYGLRPGPQLMTDHPEVMWAVIAALYVSNVILLILNLPLIGLFVRILDAPPRVMMPLILLLASIGAYSINNSPFDVVLVVVFGLLGYLLRRVEIPPVAMVLAMVLGERMEQSLRQALILSNGSIRIFFTHPISAVLLAAGVAVILFDMVARLRRRDLQRLEELRRAGIESN